MSAVQLEFSLEELHQLNNTIAGAGIVITGVLRGDALARIQLLHSIEELKASLAILARLRDMYTLAAMETTNARAN